MDGLGYVPVCSSSSMSKTCKDHVYGIKIGRAHV